MKELIGYTIKSHDNKYVGKVTQVEPLRVAKQFRKQIHVVRSEILAARVRRDLAK